MRSAIHALKYDGIRPAAVPLGRMLASAIEKLAGEAPGEMLVVPVPLHRSRLRERGFNQARVLAEVALKRLRQTQPGWELELASKALLRQRPTESQAGLTRHQRRRNVRGAFQVTDPHEVMGRHVLLVDDIYTTGATCRAAALVMMQAGAASVRVATLARAGLLFDGVESNEQPEQNPGLTSHALTATLERARRDSSHDQPSF